MADSEELIPSNNRARAPVDWKLRCQTLEIKAIAEVAGHLLQQYL